MRLLSEVVPGLSLPLLTRHPFVRRATLAVFALAMLVSFQSPAQRVLGIDISDYQGWSNNWATIKNQGVGFVWTKATEGAAGEGYHVEKSFVTNEIGAKGVGIPIGAYHFAHPSQNAPAAEFSYFWGTAGGYILPDGLTLMPMLDMEVFTGVTGANSYADWVNQWCTNAVQTAANQNHVTIRPFIYCSACNAHNFDSSIAQWISDIADYNGQNPQTGTPWSACASGNVWGALNWSAWQYSSSLSVSGISTNPVDSDVFTNAPGITNYIGQPFNTPPSISPQPSSVTAVVSSNATFSAGVLGNPTPTYQWRFNGTNIPGANSTTYTIFNVQTNNAGNYSLFASNTFGTTNSSNATLTVIVPLAITTQPTNLTAVKGTTASFNVTAVGTPTPGYQWQFNFVNIPGATSNVLTLPNVQTNKQGTYTVAVTNSSGGSIVSSNATLTVVTLPSITTQPTNLTVSQGGSATFAVAATGTATLIYQWQLGGSNISGANASTYTIANVQPGQGGNYRAVVTNNWGSITSSNAVLTVNAITPPQFTSVTVSNGVVQLVITGPVGGAYAVDVSSNLNTWTQLTTFTNTTGTYQFVDPSSTNNATGFYRARSLP